MSDENKIPLPGDEVAILQRRQEIEPYLLDATQNYPEPYYLLEYNGVPFSTLGGIQAISGQKKNGKTFLLAQLMAAVLGTGIERTRTTGCLPGLRVPDRTIDYLGHLPTVLYVDTEMEKLNSAKVLRRVHWLCGWPLDIPCERFHVLWLRSVTDTKDNKGNIKERAYEKRYRLIRQAIEVLNPDAVFIDGIRDIISDFNDNEASSALVTDLMAFAEQRQICIWNTLHMNPRPKNDDESKMRGHLGTELGNKITDTLVCIKHKEKDGTVYFTGKQDDARGKDMEDWEFVVTEAAGALGVPQMRAVANNIDLQDSKIQQERIEADDLFQLYHWTSTGATWTELRNFALSKGMKERKFSDLLNIAAEPGIVYRTDKKKYHYVGLNAKRTDNPTENLPFAPSTGEEPDF